METGDFNSGFTTLCKGLHALAVLLHWESATRPL